MIGDPCEPVSIFKMILLWNLRHKERMIWGLSLPQRSVLRVICECWVSCWLAMYLIFMTPAIPSWWGAEFWPCVARASILFCCQVVGLAVPQGPGQRLRRGPGKGKSVTSCRGKRVVTRWLALVWLYTERPRVTLQAWLGADIFRFPLKSTVAVILAVSGMTRFLSVFYVWGTRLTLRVCSWILTALAKLVPFLQVWSTASAWWMDWNQPAWSSATLATPSFCSL